MDKERREQMLRVQCREVKPLLDAILEGKDLEFHLHDGWILWEGYNLKQIIISPHRFRIAIED